MTKKLWKSVFAGFLSAGIFAGSLTAFAAEAWSLPESGLRLNAAAKQAYVEEQMGAFFHPKSGATKPTVEPFAAPNGWTYDILEMNGVKTERLVNLSEKAGRVVLNLHGGGYIGDQSDRHRQMAVKHGILAEAKEVYLVDYRLAPENVYPAALEDAAAVYRALLAQGENAENIIVTGDSAGGNLALALSLYLKEQGIEQPGALILISPWTTMETNLPSRKYNKDRDLILGTINARMYNEVKKPSYGKGLSVKDPRLSPIHADLAGLPPMLIQVGSYELFLDEGIALAKKAADDGVDVTLTVYPGMSHDFALMLPELQDSVNSFKEIRDFVKRHLGDGR